MMSRDSTCRRAPFRWLCPLFTIMGALLSVLPIGAAAQDVGNPPVLAPGLHERTLARAGEPGISYAISIPPAYSPSTPAPLILALHYGIGNRDSTGVGSDLVKGIIGPAFDEARARLPHPQELALSATLLRVTSSEPADPRTVATAVVGVLTELVRDQPVLVAIDDVQWVDLASRRALEFAVRRLPAQLRLLVTRRGEGAAEVPLELDRALPPEAFQRVVLGSLSLASLHHIVRERLGTSPTRPMIARIAEASGGNPFFALELGRALLRRGIDHDPQNRAGNGLGECRRRSQDEQCDHPCKSSEIHGVQPLTGCGLYQKRAPACKRIQKLQEGVNKPGSSSQSG